MSPPELRSQALNLAPHPPLCPLCGRTAYRVHRRLLDHAISLLIPIRRFRCGGMGCDWEGNVRVTLIASDASRR